MGKEQESSIIRFLFEGQNPRDVTMLVVHTYICIRKYPYVSVCTIQYNTIREVPNIVKSHLSLLFTNYHAQLDALLQPWYP